MSHVTVWGGEVSPSSRSRDSWKGVVQVIRKRKRQQEKCLIVFGSPLRRENLSFHCTGLRFKGGGGGKETMEKFKNLREREV